MGVLIVSNNLPPKFDGVGDYSEILFNQLAKKIDRIFVVCRDDNEITDFHSKNSNVFPIITNWNFSGCFALYNLVKKHKIKIVLLQYVPYAFNKLGLPFPLLFLMMFLRLSGLSIHTNFHEIGIRFRGENIFNKFRSFLQRFIAYSLCIISNTQQTSNSFYANLLYPFKASIIPIPSNFEFEPGNEAYPEKNPIIIAINANRCTQIFFESIQILKSRIDKNIKIIILGRANKNDIENINNWIYGKGLDKQVQFEVNKPSVDLLYHLKASTVFVQLEIVSKFGNGGLSTKSGTTATAMHLGVPIVSTCGDMTDLNLYRDNINISFVPYNVANKIANSLQKVIENKSFGNLLLENAKITYKEYMSWEHTINHYQSIIH